MPIVIDGHNLLYAIRKSYGEFAGLSQLKMASLLDEYARRCGDSVTLVFDGTGGKARSDFEEFEWVGVVFSGQRKDADTIIEKFIKDNTAPKRLRVVSNDRRLKTAAKRRKAVSVEAEVFWLGVVELVDRPASVNVEPEGKRRGISENETSRWLEEFGFDG